MSKTLTIIARVESKPEQLHLVTSEVLKLIEPTRKENGCIQYDLHQNNEKPEVFIFYESWDNLALWQIHLESNHLKSFIKNTEGALVDLDISQMTMIS